jgi:hypothetical protein
MLAICSDLDETPNWRVYHEIQRFLNTKEPTSMGPGVGLEVGNTIYFDMPGDQFAYWNTDDAGRDMVRGLIRSGHIDCLHSYGDLATTRAHAGRALDELARHGCELEVWIDHGTAVTNFGADIMCGHGDEPGHAAYHADLTCDYGIRYVWRGRVTSVIGQDTGPSLRGIADPRRPVASAATLAKEAAKQVLGRLGSPKYGMHGPNRVLRESTLRDGRAVDEFLRSNPHWGGVSSCDTGREIGHVLSERMLAQLTRREGACLLYTHLGKIDDPRAPFDGNAVSRFRRLAEKQRNGEILVTTTRRLLAYCAAVRDMEWHATASADGAGIEIDIVTDANRFNDSASLAGVTFHVDDPNAVRLSHNGRPIGRVCRNAPDHTGRPSISVQWPRLEFPRP